MRLRHRRRDKQAPCRLHARSRDSRIAPWAKGRRQTTEPPRDPLSLSCETMKLQSQSNQWLSNRVFWIAGIPQSFWSLNPSSPATLAGGSQEYKNRGFELRARVWKSNNYGACLTNTSIVDTGQKTYENANRMKTGWASYPRVKKKKKVYKLKWKCNFPIFSFCL